MSLYNLVSSGKDDNKTIILLQFKEASLGLHEL